MLRALWQYRGMIASMSRREFQIRSLRAAWGSAWLVIQPAIQIVIYTVIFSRVLRAKLPGVEDGFAYSLFLCAGLLTWGYFAEIVGRSQTLFIENAYILKAVRLPRSVLPLSLLVSATINFAIITTLFLGVLALSGRWPGWSILSALPLLGIQVVLALGLGVLGGTLNVFFRDVGQAVTVVLQFWFWLTPIVYPVAALPEMARSYLAWNPMFPLIQGYQRIVIEHAAPIWGDLAWVSALTLVAAVMAWGVFRALSNDLVDEL